MKKIILAAAGFVGLALSSCNQGSNVSLNTEKDSISFIFGNFAGIQIQNQIRETFPVDTINVKALADVYADSYLKDGVFEQVTRGLGDMDEDLFMLGFRHAVSSADPRFSLEQCGQYLQAKAEAISQAENKEREAAAEVNIAAAKAFFDENATKEGVVTLESGVQYRVVKAVSGGAKPNLDNNHRVRVLYEGSLLDGTVFDSSDSVPAMMSLRGVIKGWQEVIPLMSENEEYEIWIPADKAYGMQGAGDKIGPMQALHFNVTLVEVVAQ